MPAVVNHNHGLARLLPGGFTHHRGKGGMADERTIRNIARTAEPLELVVVAETGQVSGARPIPLRDTLIDGDCDAANAVAGIAHGVAVVKPNEKAI